MRNHSKILASLLAGALLASCTDLEVTNPNQQSSQTFWKTEEDATRGLTAAYNGLLRNGTFARWQAFANDIRSDIGTARTSPWGDLANFNAFQLNDYNFEVNREIWVHNYELVNRANLVIANVPNIATVSDCGSGFCDAERDRIVGEAKFLRVLAYYTLVTMYENVPLLTSPPAPEDRPGNSPPAATFAQMEQDLVDAIAVLPRVDEQEAGNSGRATKGAAQAMLGRVRLQMAGVLNMPAKWAEAAQPLGDVITSGKYSLLANYGDNFIESSDNNNPESLFEVENEDKYPIGVTGVSFPKMIGPCYRPGPPLFDYNPTFCDGRPTRWYLDQFLLSRTTTNAVDPRLDVTLLYPRADRAGEFVFDKPRGEYFIENPASAQREDTMIFFRKYGETYKREDQRWDNPINYKVIRYADVLLMQGEALNESGQTGAAIPFINQVRARASKAALGALSQAQLRDTILYERMFELGLEASRFNDLRRHGLLGPALGSRDLDFAPNSATSNPGFVIGKSERLPIPTNEINLNPNVVQNPGW